MRIETFTTEKIILRIMTTADDSRLVNTCTIRP